MTIDISACWAWVPCAAYPDSVRFGLEPKYVSEGPRWLRDRVRTMRDETGCDGVHIDKPFGWSQVYDNGVPQYSFTMAAALRAESRNHRRIVDSWAAFMDDLGDLRLLVYMGALQSPEIRALETEQSDDKMRLIAENLKPICESGITSIGVDFSVDRHNLWVHHTMEAWRGWGMDPWYESVPDADQPYLHDKPLICDERTWQGWQDNANIDFTKLTGPIQRFVPSPSGDGLTGEQWGVAWDARAIPMIQQIQAEDCIAVVESLDLAVRYSPALNGTTPAPN